jgi:hypothetical protein
VRGSSQQEIEANACIEEETTHKHNQIGGASIVEGGKRGPAVRGKDAVKEGKENE